MCSHLRGEKWARVSSDTAWPLWRIRGDRLLQIHGIPENDGGDHEV
jgi:hypothetical protein